MKNNTRNNKSKLYVATIVTILVIIGGTFLYRGSKSLTLTPSYTKSDTPTKMPTPTPTFTWTKITNTKFAYSIEYPSNIDEQDSAQRQPTVARELYLNDFKLLVQDSEKLDIKSYVEREWKRNQPLENSEITYKDTSSITETRIDGIVGYQFTVTHSIGYPNGADAINSRYLLKYVKKGNYVYLLAYPMNKSSYQEIANTFKLL